MSKNIKEPRHKGEPRKIVGHHNFTQTEIREVWVSIPQCRGYKECIDPWGRVMHTDHYGHKGEKGWNIDHVNPVSNGGGNEINNLQPLHWKSNKEKDNKINCEKWGKC